MLEKERTDMNTWSGVDLNSMQDVTTYYELNLIKTLIPPNMTTLLSY